MSIYRTLSENFLQYLLRVVEKKETDFKAKALIILLSILSKIYYLIIKLRLFLYKHGILRKRTFGCLTISIGNITVGGTGKTPIVEILAKALKESGRKVAILSHGYKKKEAPILKRLYPKNLFKSSFSVVADDESIILNSREAGDEPYMLAKNLPETVVIIGKNRVKSAEHAVSKFGVDTIILDDGFQYLSLDRKFDIVLIDTTNPFGNGYLLPRGTLREPPENLKRADLFFLTKLKLNGNEEDHKRYKEIKEQLKSINSKAEIIECAHKPLYLKNIVTGETVPLNYLKDKHISVVSGIARPKSFEKSLEDLGATIVKAYSFTDHHRYSEDELKKIFKSASTDKTKAIITTEKDAVRFPKDIKYSIPCFYLRVEIEILSGANDFNDCVAKLSFKN